jgi:DNA protecting protein DprA
MMHYSDPTVPTFSSAEEALLGALLWMKVRNVGSVALRKLLALNPDLWHLWWYGTRLQLQLVLKPEQVQEWQHLRQQCPLVLEAEVQRYNELGVQWIPFNHELFPSALREIFDPPAGLFIRGSLAGLITPNQVGLGIVGTRKMTPYGKTMTGTLVTGLAGTPVCVVSGLALGIDGVAHQAALAANLPTIAFLGCGVDVYYPPKHSGLASAILEADGALVSEYPLGVQPLARLFPRRNRLVVGVSAGVIVVEAPLQSGSMITARLAVQENRTVMAIPHPATSPTAAGPLQLLREGASIIWESTHILEELGLRTKQETVEETTVQQLSLVTEAVAQPLSTLQDTPTQALEPVAHNTVVAPADIVERCVWKTLLTRQQQEVQQSLTLEALLMALQATNNNNELCEKTLASHLTLLELEGWVTPVAGGRFAAVHP